jgi:hypothetical protein
LRETWRELAVPTFDISKVSTCKEFAVEYVLPPGMFTDKSEREEHVVEVEHPFTFNVTPAIVLITHRYTLPLLLSILPIMPLASKLQIIPFVPVTSVEVIVFLRRFLLFVAVEGIDASIASPVLKLTV